MTTHYPIDAMFEQPIGWLRVSLPKIESATRSVGELLAKMKSLQEARAEFHYQRWRDLTGVEPADTHFSIIIPVHNEERSLPSVLGALLASELPSTADIQIVFVVNATSDKSALFIENRLAHIDSPTQTRLPPTVCDAERSGMAIQVCQKGLRFLVVETPTAGKANALNIGNEIALQQSHAIAINLDANNWVEPDSIGLMYRSARQVIVDSPESNVVLVNAQEYCPTRNTQIQVAVKRKTQKAEVTGCLFAWSTQWIQENNGFPQHAIEDYGAGLLAFSQGKQIEESDARIWGYSSGNASDENRELKRYIYGAMQLARQFGNNKVAMQVLLDDFPFLHPMKARLGYYLFRKQNKWRPIKIIRSIMRWLLTELLIIQARQKFRRDPHSQTWEPISSTK